MPARTVRVRIHREGSMCFIPVSFDPKAVFGKVRAPVRVTVKGYTYRSTIAAMGGVACIPLRRSNREAAGLEGTETVSVKIELDTDKREVEVPADLQRALRANKPAAARWRTLSYSHRREHVEALADAKKPETRARRLDKTIRFLIGD